MFREFYKSGFDRKLHVLVIFVALCLISCYPNVRVTRKVSGTWILSETRWEGGKIKKPDDPKSANPSVWNFKFRKTGRYEGRPCPGSVTGFEGSDSVYTFEWNLYYRGTHFNLVHNKPQSPLNMLFYGGAWEIKEINKRRFIITNESCASCVVYGRATLIFTR